MFETWLGLSVVVLTPWSNFDLAHCWKVIPTKSSSKSRRNSNGQQVACSSCPYKSNAETVSIGLRGSASKPSRKKTISTTGHQLKPQRNPDYTEYTTIRNSLSGVSWHASAKKYDVSRLTGFGRQPLAVPTWIRVALPHQNGQAWAFHEASSWESGGERWPEQRSRCFKCGLAVGASELALMLPCERFPDY